MKKEEEVFLNISSSHHFTILTDVAIVIWFGIIVGDWILHRSFHCQWKTSQITLQHFTNTLFVPHFTFMN